MFGTIRYHTLAMVLYGTSVVKGESDG
jgi:hypothetical protein